MEEVLMVYANGAAVVVVPDRVTTMKRPDLKLIGTYRVSDISAAFHDTAISSVKKERLLDSAIASTDSAIQPDHYKAGEKDVIDFCQHHNVNFSRGSAIKYLTRAGKKPGVPEEQDLRKALEFSLRELGKATGKRYSITEIEE